MLDFWSDSEVGRGNARFVDNMNPLLEKQYQLYSFFLIGEENHTNYSFGTQDV